MVKLEDFKFLFNNSNYNCNIYILKIYLNIKLDFIISKKNEKNKKSFSL